LDPHGKKKGGERWRLQGWTPSTVCQNKLDLSNTGCSGRTPNEKKYTFEPSPDTREGAIVKDKDKEADAHYFCGKKVHYLRKKTKNWSQGRQVIDLKLGLPSDERVGRYQLKRGGLEARFQKRYNLETGVMQHLPERGANNILDSYLTTCEACTGGAFDAMRRRISASKESEKN